MLELETVLRAQNTKSDAKDSTGEIDCSYKVHLQINNFMNRSTMIQRYVVNN